MNLSDIPLSELLLAERGQVVIPKVAREALGLRPGSVLTCRIDGQKLVLEKRVKLNLGKWVGAALDDGLSSNEALSEMRGRPVPWVGDSARKKGAPKKRSVAKPLRVNPASARS